MGLILGTFKIKINYDTKYNQLIKTRIHKSILISVMSNSLWPMDCSTQGFPVHHQLVEIAQTHVHRLSDAIQPTILSSVVTFSSCLQSFPESGSFPMSQLFAEGGPSIGGSASAAVLSMNIQNFLPLGLTGWISLKSKGLARVFFKITVQKHKFFGTQLSLWSNSHIHTWPLENP